MFNIPTNIGPSSSSSSYSGLGQGWSDFSSGTIKPILSGLANNYKGNVNQAYDNASNAGTSFAMNQMAPGIQNILNTLNSNGVLNSSITGDVMSKGIGEMTTNAMAGNAASEQNRATALTSGYGDLMSKLALLGQGSSSNAQSSDSSTPYQLMTQLLMGTQ